MDTGALGRRGSVFAYLAVLVLIGTSLNVLFASSQWALTLAWLTTASGIVIARTWLQKLPVVALAFPLLTLIISTPAPSEGFGRWIAFGLGFAAVLASNVYLKQRLGWMIISCGLASLLLLFSGSAGGADPLRNWLVTLGIGASDLENYVIGIRKSIHVVFYGSLAFTFAVPSPLESRPAWVWAALWCLTHATFDEVRQMGTANRSGQIVDIFLDLGAASVVLATYVWVNRSRNPGLLDNVSTQ